MASKGEFSIQLKAEALGLDLEDIADNLIGEFNNNIRDLAHGTYAMIVSQAQEKAGRRNLDYLKGLSFDVIGENEYLISLEGEYPNKIEDGIPSMDMREYMLKSDKTVSVGSRAGEPWVQLSKKGHKYAHVPMEKRPNAKNPGASDMAGLIQKMKAVNQSGKLQKITQIFKDKSGNPLSGKVAVMNNFKGLDSNSKNLEGLVKYQQILKGKDGKDRVASTYMVYRTISENGKAWMAPAFEGVKAFAAAEVWLDEQLALILENFLGKGK